MKNKILSFGALLFTCFMVMAPPTSAQSDTQSFKTNSTAVGMESQQLPAAYNNSSWTVVNERTNGEGEITISGIDAGTFIIPNTSTASAPEGTQVTVVYDNGPHINMAGTPDLSVLESVTLGMNTLGGNVSNSLGYGISDEFELVAETEITGITAYAYQTGASSTTINAMYVTIWDGDPSGGGSVVWGDQTTDVFDSVEDINAYRVAEDDQGGRTRMLQKVKASISGLTLAPGTYWLEYSLDGTSSSGPWQPPIVILGEATTGNALQLTPTGYQAWLDSGTNTPQGVPFQIEGIEAGGVTYCIPEGTNSSRYINNFSTTGGSENISNMGSGFSAGGYGDFYDTHTVAQSQGEDVAFEVDVEGGTAGFRIWVDWNQDGVFDTTEEVAYASNGYSSNHTGSFTVPADALEGDTRMRIVSHWLSTTGNVDPCETGFTYGEFEDYKFIVSGGGGGTAGQTCDDPIVVSTLPYNDAGNTADYGNFYSNGDVPDLAPDAVTNGTGSPYYLSGDEVVYAYTPADDEVLNISTTNDDDWIGLWAFTGCPFTSTVGYHTSISGDTRLIEELPVTAGETYYFVISTWAPPESTDYTILIERVGGGGSGGDGALFTDTAGDPGNFFNSFAGVTFDVENSGSETVTLTGMRVPVTDGTLLDIDVYYTTTATTNVGVHQDPSEWTLLESHTGLPMLEAVAWDVETFTQVPLNNPLTLEPGDSKGIYVLVTNYDSDGVTYHYTNGNFTASDNYMTIYSNGFGSRATPFDNAFADRAFVGEIQYSLGGGGGSSDCISTIYDGGNNGSAGGAVYFDVTVGPEDIELTSFDLNTDLVGTGFSVDVYTIDGTHVGNETNQGAWTMRTSGSGTSAGEGSASTATLDDTFVLSANTTYGIALVLDGTHSHYYTNGDGTNEHFENADLALDLGAATNVPFDGTVFTPRVFNGGLCYNVGGGGGGGDDCDQGDDSNGFENGYNITAGGSFRNADDFFVSADNTLNVRSIVLNVFANEPVDSININFFEDDGGMPGATVVESVSGVVPYAQPAIGSAFGYTVYAVHVEVDLNFVGGASGTSYWMQPEAVSAVAFWEVTSIGTLGELIHTSESMGPWTPDADGVHHGVFKLHCDVVTPPDPQCLFDITSTVEPITRVVLADIDNTSSAVIDGSPALEDFTSIEGTMGQGEEYEIALEGNTGGDWTNYFTVWIDWDQNGEWENDEMYEIGSITNSTGTDGQQAIGTITVPADAPLGSTTMRVIKNFNTSPTNPCGQYSFGQGEDYTIIVEEGVGIDDQSATAFTYYPNPTSGIVNITANKDISSVAVFNILGQQVVAQSNLDNGQVDLSALATGTYVFRVMFEDGSLETFKVLKE